MLVKIWNCIISVSLPSCNAAFILHLLFVFFSIFCSSGFFGKDWLASLVSTQSVACRRGGERGAGPRASKSRGASKQ